MWKAKLLENRRKGAERPGLKVISMDNEIKDFDEST